MDGTTWPMSAYLKTSVEPVDITTKQATVQNTKKDGACLVRLTLTLAGTENAPLYSRNMMTLTRQILK